jgi:hypothetical protein
MIYFFLINILYTHTIYSIQYTVSSGQVCINERILTYGL